MKSLGDLIVVVAFPARLPGGIWPPGVIVVNGIDEVSVFVEEIERWTDAFGYRSIYSCRAILTVIPFKGIREKNH
jgi:hypothetical protein